jgi:hypothetical protein
LPKKTSCPKTIQRSKGLTLFKPSRSSYIS